MTRGPVELVQFLHAYEALGDGWVALLLTGVLAGFVARFATSDARRIGLLPTCALGVAGALLGREGGHALGLALATPNPRFLAALAGSLALAVAGRLLVRRARPRVPPAA
ncbi:MAG TPA: GlsB/YeaQ/YmgE family stress response membrane protein [Xanthomonadaceae bacterium]|nr:GlsB/YeaQ/YmgE family stress response membrane protein [Xanthomonadaceae bacterium]